MRLSRVVTLMHLVFPLFFTGCRHSPVLPVSTSDLQALRDIYDASGAIFHGSQIDIQVRSPGSVEMEVRGQVEEKAHSSVGASVPSDPTHTSGIAPVRTNIKVGSAQNTVATQDSSNPGDSAPSSVDTAGDAWIPLLLIQEMPSYVAVVPPTDMARVSVESYELNNGLWCLAAVVKRGATSIPPPDSSRSSSLVPEFLSIRIALTAQSFSHALPFFIPSGQTGQPIAISIGLPKGSHFDHDKAVITAGNSRDWRLGNDFGGSISPTAQTLISIPSATSVTGPQEGATLYSPDAIGWDFSAIAFTQPGFLTYYRPWYLPSLLVLAFCGVAVVLAFARSSLVSAIRLKDSTSEWIDADALGRSAVDAIMHSRMEAEADTEILDQIDSWRRRLVDVLLPPTKSDRVKAVDVEREMLPALRRLKTEISESLGRPPMISASAASFALREFIAHLQTLELALEGVTRQEKKRHRQAERKRDLSIAIAVALVLALVSIGFLVASLAHAQGRPPRRVIPTSMLCDLDISLSPHDPQTTPADKVDVALRFSPFTGIHDQKTGTLRIGPGNGNSVQLEDPATPSDKRLSVVQHSSSMITLGFPATYSLMLARIAALSGAIKAVQVPDDYVKLLANANKFSFTYTLTGAEAKHERVVGQSHWLFLFPFDSVDVDVPLDIRQDSLLWHLELLKPNGDLFTTPSIDGLSIALSETENADKYGFVSEDARARTAWNPRGRILVHATFRRTAFQRWGLTFGVWGLAIVVGAIAALLNNLPTGHWLVYVAGILGITAMVAGVRNTVLGTYKWLPTLMSGQGTSVFELFFVVALVLFVVSIWVTRKLIA